MYPEFVAIYIMLTIVILLLGAILFLLLKSSKEKIASIRPSNNIYQNQQPVAQDYSQQYGQAYQEQYQVQGGNIVFCKHCATQFDASQVYCPNCGTPR